MPSGQQLFSLPCTLADQGVGCVLMLALPRMFSLRSFQGWSPGGEAVMKGWGVNTPMRPVLKE